MPMGWPPFRFSLSGKDDAMANRSILFRREGGSGDPSIERSAVAHRLLIDIDIYSYYVLNSFLRKRGGGYAALLRFLDTCLK